MATLAMFILKKTLVQTSKRQFFRKHQVCSCLSRRERALAAPLGQAILGMDSDQIITPPVHTAMLPRSAAG